MLYPGQRVTSPNGRYHLILQRDGNVVVYAPGGRPLFFTGSYGAAWLRPQTDGNLVAYRANGSAAWNSGTYRAGRVRMEVQDDGNVVLYDTRFRRAVWYLGWDRGQTATSPSAGVRP